MPNNASSSPTPVVVSDEPVHFFRNYKRAIGLAYGVILLGLLAFCAYQLQRKFDAEIQLIQEHIQRYSQFVEFVIRSSADQLETLRMLAEGEATIPKPLSDTPLSQWTGLTFREEANEVWYSLDQTPDPDLSGNLVGIGRLTGRSPDFYQDLNLALIFNKSFRSLVFTLPNAAQARFISLHNFVLFIPWELAASQPFTSKVYQDPVWTLGSPEQNPDREKYWAPVYFRDASQGLLAPVAVPVYQGQRFAGVIAIDTSLDYLNRINNDFSYPLGTVFLADTYGKVLAHPQLYANPLTVEQAPILANALPEALKTYAFSDLPKGQPIDIKDYVVVRYPFALAPWILMYTVPRSALWHKVLVDYGPPMLAILLGLIAVMVVTYTVTSREFVGPAAKLVQHLAAESRFQPTNIPIVPMAWRPWFETVTKAFRESIQLMALRQELNVAAKMQIAILPRAWPVHPQYQLWGTMQAAKEVGGDFYDHFEVGGGLRGMVVADVSGKGIGPGLFGMMAKTLVRATALHEALDLSEIIAKVNDELCADNDSCIFVTLFYGLFDPATGLLRYANGGHPPPLLVHADGSAEYLPVLGGAAPGIIPGEFYPQASIQLHPGDTVLMFSDGVTEAMNATNEEFGVDRLAALFRDAPCQTPIEAVERTVCAVHEFAAGVEQSDDITCVALCYQAGNAICDSEALQSLEATP